jgi:1,4-dihydroxy-2-naphthoyl-CoA hydrolase
LTKPKNIATSDSLFVINPSDTVFLQKYTPDQINQARGKNMVEHLDIVVTEVGDDYITARMPVDHRTVQPFGLLHGGASVALAETVGSLAANLCVDSEVAYCVGLEINANHVRSVTAGFVYGTARPVHLGRTTQVWDIRIVDENNRLTCISRLTMAVVKKK